MLSRSTRLQFNKQAVRRFTVKAQEGNGELVSQLAIKIHAGSRYANKDGISHLLSKFNFQDTNSKSALRLVRESELLGGKFKSSVDREFITLKATFLKEDLPYYVNSLSEVLHNTSFKQHEFDEIVLPSAEHDAAFGEKCSLTKAENLLYNVTFRNGLGNPTLYDGVEKVSLTDVKDFAKNVYTKSNIEIYGKNVNEQELKNFINGSSLNKLPQGESLVKSANEQHKTFTNVETRSRHANCQSVAAISVPVEKKQFTEYEVLASYLSSPLFELFGLINKAKFETFGDHGLFTLFVKGNDADIVSQNIKKVVSSLKSGKDISVAKDAALLRSALKAETSDSLAAAEKDIKSEGLKNFKLDKFNYVAVGDVTKLPYLNEL